METFTIPDVLKNSTDIYKLLCRLGIGNDSDCDNEMDFTQEPKEMNWTVRIFLYSLIFLLSVLGNTLIITVLVRNGRMRTVTNLFLLSLAASDLMLCLFCIPFTLIPNLMKDFIFGPGICKGAMYFMGVSVSVSTFNLVAISLERYSAICNPLTSRIWQTKSHAAKVITATWVVSFILMLPYPIASTLVPFTRYDNTTGNMCRLVWPSDVIQQSWYVFLLLLLFLVPGMVMMTAYGLISLELYRGIKFEINNRKSSREKEASGNSVRPVDGDGCYLQPSKRKLELQQLQRSHRQGSSNSVGGNSKATLSRVSSNSVGGNSKATLSRVSSNSSATNLMAKKRVIRMLLVIVCLFFLCWTPIFSVNAWRAFHRRSAARLLSGAPISFIHLLSYTSACVNPIIYCFMNKRFRQGMLATFACCRGRAGARGPAGARGRRGNGCLCRGSGGEEDGHNHSGGTLTRFTYSSIRGSAQA